MAQTLAKRGLHRMMQGLLAALMLGATATGAAGDQARGLQPASSFAAISDRAERSRALFEEAGKVIESPRCQNCHPVGDRPTQGAAMHAHEPPVIRGADGHGAIGLRCDTCHQAQNFDAAGVPGNPKWYLAPPEMAWQQHTLGQICTEIKDPARNGKRSLAQIEQHMAKDNLVGWAWQPGGTREPAPGTQRQFGELIHAWIETGAVCPG